jgi:GTP pyrophosphokinase
MPEVKNILNLIEGGVNKKDEELITRAYEFAKHAHDGQKRMSGDPYFVHVFETAKIIAKLGMDTNTIVAGLLHDVLEDTKIKEEEMEKEFGKDIVFLVKGVTKLGTLKYRGHERHVESLRKFIFELSL